MNLLFLDERVRILKEVWLYNSNGCRNFGQNKQLLIVKQTIFRNLFFPKICKKEEDVQVSNPMSSDSWCLHKGGYVVDYSIAWK